MHILTVIDSCKKKNHIKIYKKYAKQTFSDIDIAKNIAMPAMYFLGYTVEKYPLNYSSVVPNVLLIIYGAFQIKRKLINCSMHVGWVSCPTVI